MEVKTWIVSLFKSIFSAAFNLFKNQIMNKNQLKAFIAEKIIFNLAELISQNDFGGEHVQLIDDFVKDVLLDYEILKYPKSEEKEVNLAFKEVVEEVDNVNTNDNDLVLRSGVKFYFSETENYNSEIMRFLN